jgi:UDP-GlcNAc:undecaprenyl-phosphate/decaprenyl-phosphate GlcNAc-1-phosphate transferase
MRTYFLLFTVATFSSLALTPIMRRLCQRYSWLDHPSDRRRLHTVATPRLGGVAVFLSMLLGLVPLLFIHNLFTESLRGSVSRLPVLLIPAALTLAVGAYDDLRGLKAWQKFAGIIVASIVFYAMGGRIENVTIPFVGSVHIPMVLGLVLTIFWIVGITNAFNLLDGVDGLVTGAAVFSSLVIVFISLAQSQPLLIAVSLVLSGALVGFLRYNFNPASIFLGDSGALFVGFLIAALSVEGTQKASTAVTVAIPLVALGLPIVDTMVTIIRRFLGRRPLFEGDREHIHHMLLERGWSQRRTVLVLYGVCAGFALLTLLFASNSANVTALVLFVLAVAVVIGVGQLRYHEVDELKASIRRNITNKRTRGANNIRVRRASRSVSQANTLAELLAAVEELLEIGEFARAVMILGRNGDAEWNAHVFANSGSAEDLRGAHLRNDVIYWNWIREDLKHAEPHTLKEMWALRLPLAGNDGTVGHLNLYREAGLSGLQLDINYLCTLFHEEAIKAVERILAKPAKAGEPKAARAAVGWGLNRAFSSNVSYHHHGESESR